MVFSIFMRFFVHKLLVILLLLCSIAAHAQQEDSESLFIAFEQRFVALDSLIFGDSTQQDTLLTSLSHQVAYYPLPTFQSDTSISDSLILAHVEAEVRALRHETGLTLTGQTYYRIDEGLAIDEDDAVSRYCAKIQAEIRWNFLNSAIMQQQGRIHALELTGEIEKLKHEKADIEYIVSLYEEYCRANYDSLLSGILQHRLLNLNMMNDAQMYLLHNGNISSDDMLSIINDKAEAERTLLSIAKNYPIASTLSNPSGILITVDSVGLLDYISTHNPDLSLLALQSELLAQKRDNENYWTSMNISPFIRYSYYFRNSLPNSSNVDLGVNFSIPLSAETHKKRVAMDAERMVVDMHKEELQKQIVADIRTTLKSIERLNQSSTAELQRLYDLQEYLRIRSNAYSNRKGGYNIILRAKEYNTYLLCWEKFLKYQYERDAQLLKLQMYLPDASIFDFCVGQIILR